jgi:hypothetical protein
MGDEEGYWLRKTAGDLTLEIRWRVKKKNVVTLPNGWIMHYQAYIVSGPGTGQTRNIFVEPKTFDCILQEAQ